MNAHAYTSHDWAVLLQSVVTQVGELFLAPPTGAGQPLLLSRVSEDMSSSELLFSPLPGQEHSQESNAWQVSTPASTSGTHHAACALQTLHYAAGALLCLHYAAFALLCLHYAVFALLCLHYAACAVLSLHYAA